MKLGRIGAAGAEIPVAFHKGQYRDLRSLVPDIDGRALAPATLALIESHLDSLPVAAEAGGQRTAAPIARPGAIICVGMNYAAHAAESGSPPPEVPPIFLKTPNTIAGPNDDVTIPRGSVKTDWEVELGIVIGTEAHCLDSREDARRHIAGYVLVNDVSERTFQLELSGGQWSKGKCAPGFTPVGPWLVTAEEVDPNSLRLHSRVNGESRQDSSTADLIFDVEEIVLHLSQFMALEAGDLILTGTPEGVALSGRFPYLRPGDVVETEIIGLGRQKQRFVAYEGR